MNKFTLKQRLNLQLALISGSLLSYLRDWAAIFFTLLFPLVFMVIFGLLNFGSGGSFNEPNVGIIDKAQNSSSVEFISSLENPAIPINLIAGDETTLRNELSNGGINVLLIVPAGFNIGGSVPATPSTLEVLHDPGAIVALSIVQISVGEVFDQLALQTAPAQFRSENYVVLGTPQPVSRTGQNVSYRVFLIPGILAMAIMQSAVFGIAFTLARFKVQGVLRRFQGTPAGVAPFLFSEMVARTIVLVVATAILMGVGMALFSDYRTSLFDAGPIAFFSTFVLAILGIFVFLGWALAFTGRIKSENAASGIANLTTFPMLFLSGVFFDTSILPSWLEPITQFLPLSFLIDALRAVQVDGEVLWSATVGWEILGLVVWAIGLFILARFLFRWN